MTNNNHYMLVVSLLIFAAPFLAAHWLDSRKVLLAKGGSKETKPKLAPPIARNLTRELLTTWMISSTVWVVVAIEHILGSCNRGPDGFSCLIGGNNWILQTYRFGWLDAFRISLFLAAFPVVGFLVGTATLWVLTGFARPEDPCDRD